VYLGHGEVVAVVEELEEHHLGRLHNLLPLVAAHVTGALQRGGVRGGAISKRSVAAAVLSPGLSPYLLVLLC
jgi:hypothetical protein